MRRFKTKSSKAEKEILLLLKKYGYKVITQFRIDGVPYIYDFYLPDLNILLEYNGDYWHANPNKYASSDKINMVGLGKIFAKHVWDKDQLKLKTAEQYGFEVRVLWERDYKRSESGGWLAVERCIKR